MRSHNLRAGLVALAVATTLLAQPADAACSFLTDPVGDDAIAGNTATRVATDPQVDLIGADIASSRRGVTISFRLAEFGPVAPSAPLGRVFLARFTAAKDYLDATWTYPREYYVLALLRPTGDFVAEWGRYSFGVFVRHDGATVRTHPNGEVRATFDFSRVPKAAELGTPAAWFYSLHVFSYRLVFEDPAVNEVISVIRGFIGLRRRPLLLAADVGTTTRAYRGGTRACIPAP